MNLRELAISICIENGMSQEETDAFIAHCDSNGTSGGMEECKKRTVEELSEKDQEIFIAAMRTVIPVQVEQFRRQSGHQSISLSA